MNPRERVVPDRLAADIAEGTAAAPGQGPVATALGMIRAVEDRSDREAAFVLLAADAMLTSACEAASRSADPGRELNGLMDGVLEDLG